MPPEGLAARAPGDNMERNMTMMKKGVAAAAACLLAGGAVQAAPVITG